MEPGIEVKVEPLREESGVTAEEIDGEEGSDSE